MASIKIYGDIENSSIFFINSTVDPKPLNTIVATLKADEDRIVVQRNDRFESDGVTFRTIFKRLNPNRVQNKEGQDLVSQLGYTIEQVIEYINEQANLTSGTSGGDGSGTDLTGESMGFKLDATSTSIMFDNGFEFGVNTIKAIDNGDGCITIVSQLGDLNHFKKLDHTLVSVNGESVSGGLNDVINTLNELFTVGAFEQVVISDPYATMIADVDGVADGGSLVGSNVIDPAGNDLGANTTTHNNNAGYLSANTINQAGEYFTFDIRGEGQIGFGLVHTEDSFNNGHYSGNSTYANPASFCNGVNSSHYGYQFAHFFHPTPNGSWTNYGANTSYSMRSGWSSFPDRQNWLDGNPVKMRVGIDENGYISIDSYDPTTSTFVPHARTSYVVPEGVEFKLGIKFSNPSARLYSEPKVHLLEEVATDPTSIGDETITVFGEGITGTLAGGISSSATDNFDNDGFITSESISSIGEYFEFDWSQGGDFNFGLFSENDHNIEDVQADTSSWSASKFIFFGSEGRDGGGIQGYRSDSGITHTSFNNGSDVNYKARIGFDASGKPTIWGSSDNGVNWFIVIKANSSAPVGDYKFIFVAEESGVIFDGITKGLQSFAPTMYFRYIESPDGVFNYPLFATQEEAEYYDKIVNGVENGSSHTHTYADDPTNTTWYMPEASHDASTYQHNSAPNGLETFNGVFITYTEITSRTNADLAPPLFTQADLTYQEGTVLNLQVTPAGATWSTSASISPLGSGLVFDGNSMFQGTLSDVPSDTEYTVTVTRGNSYGSTTGSFKLNVTNVAPPQTNDTPWNKALDFSGSNEHAKQVSTSFYSNAMRMNHLSNYVPFNVNLNKTSDNAYARPWATAVVFKPDFNNSNQHIWNFGEGSGSNDDNIYLRLSASRELFFGWGRGNSNNECRISSYLPNNLWFGVYVGHKGYRASNTQGASAQNLEAAFDIRFKASNDWDYNSGNLSTISNWTSGGIGVRMDRQVTGDFTIGGRGSNRNFHGKVASMVVTTLKRNTVMPSDNEVKLMITDPLKWEADYLVGNTIRQIHTTSNVNYSTSNLYNGYGPVQIWLMGDGTSDSYANGIRNQVYPNDQNYGKLQLNSMVSNDIQNVNINGLT